MKSTIYMVNKGDTLSMIARKHDVSLRQIIDANPNIQNPDNIYVNQKVKIPTRPGSKSVPCHARKSPKVMINGKEVEDATPAQAKQVSEAHTLAIKYCQSAIRQLEAAKSAPYEPLERLFDIKDTNPGSIALIGMLSRKFQELMQGFGTIQYDVDWSIYPGKVASAPRNWIQRKLIGNDISLYSLFFEYPTVAQAQTLLHEMSHFIHDTEDHAYAEECYTLSMSKKFNNADNYGLFGYEAHNKVKMY